MKKTIAVIILILMFFLNTVVVFAGSNTYRVEPMELSICIPDDYLVITRETLPTDPVFTSLGIDGKEFVSYFESSNIYFEAVSPSIDSEIVLTMTDGAIADFNLLGDVTIKSIISSFVEMLKESGVNVSKYEIYNHQQAKFVKLFWKETSTNCYGIQYFTSYDGKSMNVTFRSYSGPFSIEQEQETEATVNSVIFDGAPEQNEEVKETPQFEYEDYVSKIRFTVPENWEEAPLSKERETIDIKFKSIYDPMLLIMFGATDYWSTLTPEERIITSRSSLNDLFLTKEDIADVFSDQSQVILASSIEDTYYNGVHYFEYETKTTSNVYGIQLTVTITNLVHFRYGWAYMFQFSDDKSNSHFSDFERLMNSIEYGDFNYSEDTEDKSTEKKSETNQTSEVNQPETEKSPAQKQNNSNYKDIFYSKGNEKTLIVAIIIIVVVIGMTVIIILAKNSSKKKRNDYSPAFDNLKDVTEPELRNDKENTYIKCPLCGSDNTSESSFCYKCGKELPKSHIPQTNAKEIEK